MLEAKAVASRVASVLKELDPSVLLVEEIAVAIFRAPQLEAHEIHVPNERVPPA